MLRSRKYQPRLFISSAREVRIDVAPHDVDQLRDVREVVELVVLELFDRQVFDLLLALDPARIAARIVTEARVRDGLVAVHVRAGRA